VLREKHSEICDTSVCKYDKDHKTETEFEIVIPRNYFLILTFPPDSSVIQAKLVCK
jgi:hypothetical protein